MKFDFPNDYQHADDQKLFVKGHMQRQNAKSLVGTSMSRSPSMQMREVMLIDDSQ